MHRYFCHGSHMSAVLKKDIARVRAAKPEYYKPGNARQSSMDDEGKVTISVNRDVRAIPIGGRERHRLSLSNERH